MMRLCVIGNSHVGALRLGWTSGDVTYFASHARSLRSLRQEGDRLVSDDADVRRWLAFTSGGQDSIAAGEYDAFLIVGCGLGFATTTTIYRRHRLPQHVTADEHVISIAALRGAANTLIAHSLARKVADLVAGLTTASLAILPEPLPAPQVVLEEQPWLRDREIRAVLMDVYNDSAAQIPHVLLKQPAHTVAGDFTKPEFSRGSVKLLEGNRRHGKNEPYHMNADFGAAVMAEAMQHFSSAAPESVVADAR